MNITIFGDSIAAGAWDDERGGWVSRLGLFINEQSWDLTYNCSISGDSTREVISRFSSEAKSREANIVIFALGVNDSWINEDGSHNVDIDTYRKNMENLVDDALSKNMKCFLIESLNVDESKTTPVSWDSIAYLNNTIQQYNQVLEDISSEKGVQLIKVFGIFDQEDLLDGIHPNASGHEKVFRKLSEELSFLKELSPKG